MKSEREIKERISELRRKSINSGKASEIKEYQSQKSALKWVLEE